MLHKAYWALKIPYCKITHKWKFNASVHYRNLHFCMLEKKHQNKIKRSKARNKQAGQC